MLRQLLFGAFLALLNTGVLAATVVLNGSAAVSIQRLDINGIFYDVSFERVTGSSSPITAYAPGDLFANNSGQAQQAVNAINDALRGAGIQLVGVGANGNGANTYVVPYSFANSCQDFCAYRGFNSGSINWRNLDSDVDSLADIEFARFAVSAVPVPPALYLFLSGLGMFGVARRRCTTG